MPKFITETARTYGTKGNRPPDLEPRPELSNFCAVQVKRLQVPLQPAKSGIASGSRLKAAARQKPGTLIPCAATSYSEDTRGGAAITS